MNAGRGEGGRESSGTLSRVASEMSSSLLEVLGSLFATWPASDRMLETNIMKNAISHIYKRSRIASGVLCAACASRAGSVPAFAEYVMYHV